MGKLAIVLSGGAIGTLLRYWVVSYFEKLLTTTFPVGTLVVNSLGSFIAGFIFGLLLVNNFSDSNRVFLMVGILGGFTTFSAFMFETLTLIEKGEIRMALSNLVITNISGLISVILGFFLAKGVLMFLK